MNYFESPTLHQCLIKLPDKFSPEKKYHLVIGLHGGSGTSINFIKLWEEIQNKDFIFAAPQGPYPMVSNGELSFDWGNWPSGDEKVISKASSLSEKYIKTVSQELRDKYKCGDIYLLGFSQGAIFSYLVALKNSADFKGLIALSGPGLLFPLNNPFGNSIEEGWLSEKEIKKANNLRVFITHGKDDQTPPIEFGIKSREVLANLKHEVTFRDFEGGHQYPPKAILEEICLWIVAE
jgi:phospholipase/carboxylesterase